MASKTDKPAAKPVSDEITLDEFCRIISRKDKRVELIGGFYADTKSTKNAKVKDTQANWATLFTKFIKRPVA